MKKLPLSATKLKVAIVLDDSLDTTDGVQQYVLSIGSWLNQQGHEVHYLVGATKRKDIANLHSLSQNVKVRFNGNNLSIPLPAPVKVLKQLLAKEKFDVIHVQMPFSPFLAGRLISLASEQTAIVGTFHIAPYGRMASFGARLLGIVTSNQITRFDQILAVSQPAADLAKNIYHVKSAVLGNAFDYPSFAQAKPYSKTAQLELLFLGRLVKRKDCLRLIEALALLERSHNDLPAYRLRIVGDGPLRESLQSLVSKYNLVSKVEFIGYVSEQTKRRYLASSDIAIFPSLSGESFGYVLVEAMANGRTVVLAAANPGYASLLNALPESLFAVGDTTDLAQKLKHCLSDPLLRRQLANRGQIIAANFDRQTIGTKLVDYYLDALLKRQP